MPYADRLEECARIARERESQYGSIESNFGDTALILSVVFGINLTPAEIAKVYVAGKLSRQKFKAKQDNVDDAANYLIISDELDGNG